MKAQSTPFRFAQAYKVDLVVLGMFTGVLLDTMTTWFMVLRHRGFEQNPILAPLIRHSLIWIPIYLMCRPLLVPFLPAQCRSSFGIFYGFEGLLFGINNLAGILYHHYFLVDRFGYSELEWTCVTIAVAVFAWVMWRRARNARERTHSIVAGLSWIGIFVLLELCFFAAGRIPPSWLGEQSPNPVKHITHITRTPQFQRHSRHF
jgi:hypothetical protein